MCSDEIHEEINFLSCPLGTRGDGKVGLSHTEESIVFLCRTFLVVQVVQLFGVTLVWVPRAGGSTRGMDICIYCLNLRRTF